MKEYLGFDPIWRCKKCKRLGGFWWAIFHRHGSYWRETHPGAHEDWRTQ